MPICYLVYPINPCCYAAKLWVTDISYFCIYMNWPQNSHRTEGVWESGKVQVCRCKSLPVSKCKSLQMQKSSNAQMQHHRLDVSNPRRNGKSSIRTIWDMIIWLIWKRPYIKTKPHNKLLKRRFEFEISWAAPNEF